MPDWAPEWAPHAARRQPHAHREEHRQPARRYRHPDRENSNRKLEQLDEFREDATDEALTTNTGTRIADNQNSLKAGERGPSLLEDFILREKITHFDHERIPERIVHAARRPTATSRSTSRWPS